MLMHKSPICMRMKNNVNYYFCRHRSGIESVYSISFQYFATMGMVITIIVGLISSYIAGIDKYSLQQ